MPRNIRLHSLKVFLTNDLRKRWYKSDTLDISGRVWRQASHPYEGPDLIRLFKHTFQVFSSFFCSNLLCLVKIPLTQPTPFHFIFSCTKFVITDPYILSVRKFLIPLHFFHKVFTLRSINAFISIPIHSFWFGKFYNFLEYLVKDV